MDIEEILGTLREQIGSLKEIEKERYSNPEKIYKEVQRIAEEAEQSLDELEEEIEELMESQDDDDDDDDDGTSREEELEAYKKAANEGDTDAMMALGEIFSDKYWNYDLKESDTTSAIEWYKKAAELGVKDAMMALGAIYEYESEETLPEAVAWYEKAFAAGDKCAAGALMRLFYRAKDYEKTYEWIQKGQAQDADSSDAQYFLGLLHMKGNGPVPQDGKKAQTYLEKAAEAGNTTAMLVVGDMYRDGIGIEVDHEKALALYKTRKDKGDWEASIAYWKLKKPEANDWVFAVLRDVLVEQLGVDEDDIGLNSEFIEDLGADSLDIVEIIMAVEEIWWVEIHDEEAEKLSTVQDLVDWLVRKYQQGECRIENGERPLEILYSRKRKSYLRR